jgi:rfaE bifunctional protein kinase chain/domain
LKKKESVLKIENVKKYFEDFNSKNILIIGDVMVDSYLWGNVNRISPEAPVPIISVEKRENRLGGAANVALNIKALGANPIVCSVIGDDDKGKIFLSLLKKREISDEGIIKSSHRPTSSKTRVIGHGQHLLRVDEETINILEKSIENQFLSKIIDIINLRKIDAIIFEDYDKGVLTKKIIEEIISLANRKNISTTVDPKKRNFLSYKHVSLFKPNLKELIEGLKLDINKNNKEEIFEAVEVVRKKLDARYLFTTLSELGVYIKSENEGKYFPALIRQIADVSGAGDTVISVATLCLTVGMKMSEIAFMSNLAGGLVCERIGVVPIEKNILLKNLM